MAVWAQTFSIVQYYIRNKEIKLDFTSKILYRATKYDRYNRNAWNKDFLVIEKMGFFWSDLYFSLVKNIVTEINRKQIFFTELDVECILDTAKNITKVRRVYRLLNYSLRYAHDNHFEILKMRREPTQTIYQSVMKLTWWCNFKRP